MNLNSADFTDEAGTIWYYDLEDEGTTAVIRSSTNATGAVTIPNVVNGIPVKSIGPYDAYSPPIFGFNSSVTSVIVPEGITLIGNYAFQYCSSLTNIIIPSTVTILGGYSFSSCTGLTNIVIPPSVKNIGSYAFSTTGIRSFVIPGSVTNIGNFAFSFNFNLTNIIIPNSVLRIGDNALGSCPNLVNVSMPDRFITQADKIGISGEVSRNYLINSLVSNDNFVTAVATNEAFVTAVANKILTASNNYGLATQSGVSNTITATTSNLATKAELTASLAQSRTDGINSVISNPNLWTLYTTNQIKAMAMGDLMLTRTNGGHFVLNYDIEQSDDLTSWQPYQNFAMPLTNLPTDKAFVRIRMKNQQ